MIQQTAYLLENYLAEGILVHSGPAWLQQVLDKSIAWYPHVSSFTHNMKVFIHGEIIQRVQDGFSVLILAADAVRVFGGKLNMSYITVVPQDHNP